MQRLIILLCALCLPGCSSISPYQTPNHREEGPQGGLLTGPDGEWVIKTSPTTTR